MTTATADASAEGTEQILVRERLGPVTRSRQRRTLILYVAMCATGLTPWLLGASARWQTFGLGLWAPGAGFVELGGWSATLFPVTIVLFAVAVFGWFATGAVILPLLIWLGSAGIAAAMVGEAIWTPAPYIVVGLAIVLASCQTVRLKRKKAAQIAVAMDKRDRMAPATAELDRVGGLETGLADRELNDEQLRSNRYLFDRALQPIDAFDGFDRIDIFQTAAVRYQINVLGYALSQLQSQWTPNFHGYLSEAQRRLIEKYLLPSVWSYWKWESMWGHFNFTNWDPVGRDNIMLTGWYAGQVALYQGNTGDDRYDRPGALTFQNKSRTYPHNLRSMIDSIEMNMASNPYCLYPCEPNWIYPPCNIRAMHSLAAYDRATGSDYIHRHSDRWLRHLDAEFTDFTGSIIALRSEITGIELPFPAEDYAYAHTIGSFEPARGKRLWAIRRERFLRGIRQIDGMPILEIPKVIDIGNYKPDGRLLFGGLIMQVAEEFGDGEVAIAAQNAINRECGRIERGGVISYTNGSNVANIFAAHGKFSRRGDVRRSASEPMAQPAQMGPILSAVPYPAVLVARAMSEGADLDITLVPTSGTAVHKVELARLQRGLGYRVVGRPDLSFVADAAGQATLAVELRTRTRLHIVPHLSMVN